jgi:hypothetical protein
MYSAQVNRCKRRTTLQVATLIWWEQIRSVAIFRLSQRCSCLLRSSEMRLLVTGRLAPNVSRQRSGFIIRGRILHGHLDPLKMRLSSLETSGTDNPVTQRHIPEGRRPRGKVRQSRLDIKLAKAVKLVTCNPDVPLRISDSTRIITSLLFRGFTQSIQTNEKNISQIRRQCLPASSF